MKILPFDPGFPEAERRQVGRVHPDGSITFRGRRYSNLREVPPECCALRTDVETHVQWARMYRAIDPRRRRAARPVLGR